MTTDANKAVLRRYWEQALNGRDLTLLDELFAPDFVAHGDSSQTLDDFRRVIAIIYSAFPDIRESIEDLIAEGDKAVVRFTATGTPTGEFMGLAPTGRGIQASGISIFRLAGGKIVERWSVFDELGMMRQLGALPSS